MYYIKRPVYFDKPVEVPTDMYKMKPICDFVDHSVDIRFLSELQNDIIAKIEVLNHNLAVIANRAGVVEQKEDNIIHLDKLQENILTRLELVSQRIQKFASKANVPIILKPTDGLGDMQDNIVMRINDLKTNIEKFADQHGCKLPTINKRLKNISIFANSQRPPLSILLLLRLLKSRGYKVACRSYSQSIQSPIEIAISEFADTYLNLDEPRYSYEMVVSIIWKEANCEAINDLICYENVTNEVPLVGEMVTLVYLCLNLGIDLTLVLGKLENLNDDLLYKRSIKSGVALFNKMGTDISGNGCHRDLCLSAFAISCLVQSHATELVNSTLGANINAIIDQCGARQLVDLIVSSK